jgi:integrase
MKKPYRLFKRGKTWYYKLPNEKSFHTTGKTVRSRAEDYVLKILNEGKPLQTGKTLRQFVNAWHFFEWGECRWIQSQHEKGRSFSQPVARQRHSHLDKYILPQWGDKLLLDLDGFEIEQWLLGLKLSNQTRNHIRSTFNIIMKTARRQRLIKHNPIDDCEPLPIRWAETAAFSPAEIVKLFPKDLVELQRLWAGEPNVKYRWKARGRVEDPRGLFWATFFLAMATSGMRSQEVRALKWKAVRPDLGGVLVILAVKEDGTIGEPKGKEYRGILLPKRTLDMLSFWHTCTPQPKPDHWVFFSRAFDQPVSRRAVKIYFDLGVQRAGIMVGDRRLSAHSFRHTYNSMVRGILPGSVLRELTGHKSQKMSDRYDHPELEYRLRQLEPIRKKIEETFKC